MSRVREVSICHRHFVSRDRDRSSSVRSSQHHPSQRQDRTVRQPCRHDRSEPEIPDLRRWHRRWKPARPPVTPQSRRRRIAAIEFRAIAEIDITVCAPGATIEDDDQRRVFGLCKMLGQTPCVRLCRRQRKVGRRGADTDGVGPRAQRLGARPIWPSNRRLDCSTARRAISFSVNSAREAAIGMADLV
jgi:hypothetical protein